MAATQVGQSKLFILPMPIIGICSPLNMAEENVATGAAVHGCDYPGSLKDGGFFQPL